MIQRFLLPRLQITTILQEETIYARRNALNTTTQSHGDAFSAMTQRILQSKSRVGEHTLMLLHLAYRPLKLNELQHALAVVQGIPSLEKTNIPPRK